MIWIWLLTVLLITAGITLWASWHHSKTILFNPKRRVPLTIFPDMFRLPYEKISFLTKDRIMLRGWFIPAPEESDKTVLVLHGMGNNRGDMLQHTHFLHEAGFNLMYFDFRAAGESDGSMSTVGYLETRDLEAALDFLKTHKEEESKHLGVYGLSMGSSVAVYSVAHDSTVKSLLLEACFDSYEKTVGRWAWIHMKIPYYPFVHLALFFVRAKLKQDPEEYSPKFWLSKIAPRPLLMIHGSHDELCGIKDAQALFKTAGEPKDLWLVPGATHGKCAEVGGEEYKKRVTEFFTRTLA